MASLQSSRSQCCCCAIGVFAALFGIIMLSAGICIVLNVSYMEVDTSGLPPELHNDDGKKVVGIILICVALGAMGLSTTVSIIYFAVCNRKQPRRPTANSNAAGTGNEAGVAANGNSGSHGNGAAAGNSSSQSQNHRSRSTSDSQLSLNSVHRQRRPSPSLNAGRGARKKVQKAKTGKNHRTRHPRYQTGLAPTIEEPETSKSQVDLKHKSADSHHHQHHHHSAAHGEQQPSTSSYTVDETSVEQDAFTQSTSFSVPPYKSGAPPVIVINGGATGTSSSSHPHQPSTSYEGNDSQFQSVDESASYCDPHYSMMTEESTVYDDTDMVDEHFEQERHQQQSSSYSSDAAAASAAAITNYADSKAQSSFNHSDSHSSSDSSSSSDQGTPPQPRSSPHHPPASASTSTSPAIATSAGPSGEGDDVVRNGKGHKRGNDNDDDDSSIDSYARSNSNIVQVQPKGNSKHFSYPKSAVLVDDRSSPSHQLDDDRVSELPTSSRHHEMYADKNSHDANDNDRRCDSRSSFNSAFSNDGGDPDDDDMRKMHQKMRELLD